MKISLRENDSRLAPNDDLLRRMKVKIRPYRADFFDFIEKQSAKFLKILKKLFSKSFFSGVRGKALHIRSFTPARRLRGTHPCPRPREPRRGTSHLLEFWSAILVRPISYNFASKNRDPTLHPPRKPGRERVRRLK